VAALTDDRPQRRLEQGGDGGFEPVRAVHADAERCADDAVRSVGPDQVAYVDTLWLLTSFDAFDLLFTGRELPADEVAARLTATAECTLLMTGPATDKP
jgi:hypothetical protein